MNAYLIICKAPRSSYIPHNSTIWLNRDLHEDYLIFININLYIAATFKFLVLHFCHINTNCENVNYWNTKHNLGSKILNEINLILCILFLKFCLPEHDNQNITCDSWKGARNERSSEPIMTYTYVVKMCSRGKYTM